MSTGQAVVVWGEVLWDRFPDGDRLGGAPANLAWHLGQAGGWVQLVTRVGDDDEGRRALAILDEFVDTSLAQYDPELRTGEVKVAFDGSEPRYTLQRDRAWERIACTEAVATAIREAGVFVYGTLAQRTPAGHEAWRTAIGMARSCLRVCDVNLRINDQNAPAIGEAIAAANILKVNDRELATLAGWMGWIDPISTLRDQRILIVTHGDAGSTLYGEQVIAIPGVRARPGGDNVGCGDAYLAILVHGMTLGWDLATCGRAASRWAAAVAEVRGATPVFDDAHIAALLETA